MANNRGQMSDELFKDLIKEDYWISNIAMPVTCLDKFHNFKHYRTCTYPDEFIVSEEQISFAKKEFSRRHDELISGIKKGDLCFVAMGGDFTPLLENGVGNHRMRGEFKNKDGRHFFIEFTTGQNPNEFYIDFSIDRDLEKQREKEREEVFNYRKEHNLKTMAIPDIQDYYNAMGATRSVRIPSTWDAVLDFVNRTYGCDYKNTRLFKFFINPDEYVCFC